ncbi:hypothetical protein ACFOJ6_08145 [Gordonia humi]|uniref:hypothetical protein n=1 Tax=Gordonia humi TaxID=686429 RepID=UPI00361009A4
MAEQFQPALVAALIHRLFEEPMHRRRDMPRRRLHRPSGRHRLLVGFAVGDLSVVVAEPIVGGVAADEGVQPGVGQRQKLLLRPRGHVQRRPRRGDGALKQRTRGVDAQPEHDQTACPTTCTQAETALSTTTTDSSHPAPRRRLSRRHR